MRVLYSLAAVKQGADVATVTGRLVGLDHHLFWIVLSFAPSFSREACSGTKSGLE